MVSKTGHLRFSPRLVVAFILAIGCAPVRSSSQYLIRTQVQMGSVPVTITVRGANRTAVEATFEECRRLERLFSRWIPESDVARLNREAGHHPVRVSPETFDLLRQAIRMSKLSDGSFDITYPSAEGDYRDIELATASRAVRFRKPGLKVDTDGIAKGLMVDQMIAVLQRQGVADAMVNASGDLRAIGYGPEGPWRVKIQDPRRPRGDAVQTIALTAGAVASAGFYERGPHIYSPKTRQPIEWKGLAGVTVVARDAATANALATAVWVMGPVEGDRFAKRLAADGIAVHLIP